MVWMVTLRITEPPWYTTGIRGPVGTSCVRYAGSRPMAKPTRGFKTARPGAAAADPHAIVNATSTASAPTKAAPQSTLPPRIGCPPYRTGDSAWRAQAVGGGSIARSVETRGAGGYAG